MLSENSAAQREIQHSVCNSATIKQQFNHCVRASVRESKGEPLEIDVLWVVKRGVTKASG